MELFSILLKALRPLCNATRSSVLVVVGVLYLPLHFIINVVIIVIIIIIIIIITIIVIIILLILPLLLISLLLFQLLLQFLSIAIYCSYEVS